MRIALVHSGTDLYGASRSLLRLASGLVKDGHEVDIILPGEGPLLEAAQAKAIKVHVVRSLRCIHRREIISWRAVPFFLGMAHATEELAALFQRLKFDLVHSNTATILNASVAAKAAVVPHIWHVRDIFAEFGPLWSVYARWILGHSVRVICVSQAVADQFNGIPHAAAKVRVIHNGISRGEFDPPAGAPDWDAARHLMRRGLGIKESCCAIGVLGRIKWGRKGQDVLIRAVRGMRDLDFRVVIAGAAFKGNEDHEIRLRKLIEEEGLGSHVILTGEVESPLPLYAALDVVVLPSATPEPFAGVVIEAMAMSKPVVGTATGGTSEQIDEGVTGLLVPPGDPTELSIALRKLVEDSDLRRGMGRAGRIRYEGRFAFGKMYEEILKCYREATCEKIFRAPSAVEKR